MSMLSSRIPIYIAAVFINLTFISSAFAVGSAGFENATYSARSLAQGNAVVARPDEPDAVVYNPAGLPDLKGIQYSGGLAGIYSNTWFHSSVDSSHERSKNQLVLIPNALLSVNPGKYGADRLGFGIATTSPFGLQNRYDSIGRMGRYTGYQNFMNMVGLTLNGGLKICDKFSVGAGAVDYLTYRYDQVVNLPNSFLLSAAVPGNTFPDGLARVETDGSGWGWTFGALAKPFKHHRLGMYYRSRATVDVAGQVKIENINPLLAGTFPSTPNFQTGTKSAIHLPSNWTFAYAYVPSDKWSVEFDWGYTGWHVFKNQNFTFDRPNVIINALGTIPRDFQDSWSFNLGGHYRLNNHFDLMGGSFFYTAAEPKDHYSNVIPDSNRIGWTCGLRWDLDKKKTASLDFAYLAMLYTSRKISNPTVFNSSGQSIDGKYTSFLNEFMISFTYRFDLPFTKSAKDTADVIKAVQKS